MKNYFVHSGVKGMKWYVRRYQNYDGTYTELGKMRRKHSMKQIIKESVDKGDVSDILNKEKQARHVLGSGYKKGKSYLEPDIDPEKLYNELKGTGSAIVDKNGNWLRKEVVAAPYIIATNIDKNGEATKTHYATIHYSNTGSHIVPRKEKDGGPRINSSKKRNSRF